MRFKGVLLVLAVILLFLGCSASKQLHVANAALDTMMQQEAFKVEVQAAEPQVTQAMAQIANSGILPPGNNISRIDVTGEGYFIKLNDTRVAAELPYYGERQMGGGYGSDSGIRFDGIARDVKIVKDAEKNSYVVTFSVDNSSENYFFTIDIGSSLNSTVRVRSSHRNRIRFTGKVIALEDGELVSKKGNK